MTDGASSSSGPRQHQRPPSARQPTPRPRQNVYNPVNDVVMTHEIHRSYSRKMINQYEIDHKIGSGQHGDVFLARDSTKSGMEVAIKSVKRKNPRDRMSQLRKRNIPASPHLPLTDQLGSTEQKIRKEIAIMKKCCHPHVVRLLEVIDDPLNERIFMVMEYLGGGEIKWRTVNEDPVLRVDQTRRICRDVILGLEYLHHQGIIHRDIKPANLLWTADRRTVKITDFGVSHFSYAQRLAAAGAGNVPLDDPDPILMDDSDLSKTAGTPMFLAPEIITDMSDLAAAASSSSSTLNLSPLQRRKPPITKAIDVWAFGVTLYGLLFGHLPFQAETEWDIYEVIRRQDWTVDPTMGVDEVPTGGRHQRPQPKGEETEGYLVIKLLERLLEKDFRKRITLDEVKRHPWVIRDLENPHGWWRETRLDQSTSTEPTPDETSSAMSSIRFVYSSPTRRERKRREKEERDRKSQRRRITEGIASWIRNVRPQKSFFGSISQRDADDQYKYIGTQSAPQIRLSRRTTTGASRQQLDSREEARGRDPREKGKQRLAQRVDVTRTNKSTTDVSRTSKSFEPWAMWNAGAASGSGGGGPSSIQGSAAKPRRGSFPSKMPGIALEVPAKSSRVSSPQPSPGSISISSTPSGEGSGTQSPEERPRSRMSWSWMLPWRNRSTTQHETLEASSLSAETTRRSSIRRSRHRLARRSEDAFNTVAPSRQSTASGPLTFAMRAASWGEVADYARPSEDLTSLYSGERGDDMLDQDTLFLGAGGVAQSPVPSIPSGLLSTVSSMNSLGGAPISTAAISVAHAILQRSEGGEPATEPDPAAQDASALARQSQIRPATTSPLAQVSYNPAEIRFEHVRTYGSEEYDDASSLFGAASSILSHEDDDVELQPSTSQMYQEEDDESDDDDEIPLEVRTRRPSGSATDRSPPRNSESAHRERAMICI